jgi:hypothetical protein
MEFIATAESDLTLKVMLDLEQLIGKEIIWVTGDTFETIIKHRGNYLPNIMARFCTSDMKIKPIFDWWIKNFEEKVYMNIGYRYDEKERGFDKKGNKKPEKPFKHIIGKHESGKNKWQETQWRITSYPMITDRIFHHHVRDWADSTSLIFPNDSNCVGCFWKQPQQLRKNFEDEPLKMNWFKDQESEKRKWKKEMRYESIEKLMLQQDFFFGTGTGCQAGYCTD